MDKDEFGPVEPLHHGEEFGPVEPIADKPNEGEASARGLAHGATFGFAPAIAGGASALMDELRGDPRSLAEAYAAERKDSLSKFKAAHDAHPYFYNTGDVAGNVVGGFALAPLTGGASLAGAAGAGALAGGLSGLGDSTSEGADLGDTVKNVGVGAVGGGLAGGLGHGLGAAVGAGIRKFAPSVTNALDTGAIASGRRAVNGGANSLSTKVPLSGKQILRYLDDKVISTGDHVGSIAKKMGVARDAAGKEVGNVLDAADRLGVKGATPNQIAERLSDRGNDMGQNSLNTGVPETYAADAQSALDLPRRGYNEPIDLQQQNSMKGSAHQEARAEYEKAGPSSVAGDQKVGKAAALTELENESLQKAADTSPAGSPIRSLNENFQPIKQTAGDYTAGDLAATKGAYQAEKRNLVSPSVLATGLVGLATGHIPLAALGAGAMYVGKKYGAAATASGLRNASRGVSRIAELAATNPQALGKFGGILSRAVAQGPVKIATLNFVLAKDPAYQQLLQHHADGTSNDAPPDEPQTP